MCASSRSQNRAALSLSLFLRLSSSPPSLPPPARARVRLSPSLSPFFSPSFSLSLKRGRGQGGGWGGRKLKERSPCLSSSSTSHSFSSEKRELYSVEQNKVKKNSASNKTRFHFSDRCVQLSTTDIFCPKNGKCCTIKYYVRQIQNPGFWVNTKYST